RNYLEPIPLKPKGKRAIRQQAIVSYSCPSRAQIYFPTSRSMFSQAMVSRYLQGPRVLLDQQHTQLLPLDPLIILFLLSDSPTTLSLLNRMTVLRRQDEIPDGCRIGSGSS